MAGWQTSLALGFVALAALYSAFQWGASHEKNKNLTAENAALIEYVKAQKEVTDAYKPIFENLKTAPKNAIDPYIDSAIDSVPNPSGANKRLRSSGEAAKTKR